MKFPIPFLFAAFASPVLGANPNVEICDPWDGEPAADLPLRKKLQIRIDCFLPNGNSCLNKTEVVAYHQELNLESECECQWYQIDLRYKLFNRFQTATEDNVYKKGENMQIAYGTKMEFCVKAGPEVILTNNQEDDCMTYEDSHTVNGFAGLGPDQAYEFDENTSKIVEHSMMVNTCYDETMDIDLKAKFGLKWADNTKQKYTCAKTVTAKFPTEIPWFSCPVATEIIISEKPAVTMPGKGPKSPGKGTKAPGNTAPGKGTKAPGNTAPGKGTKAPGSAVRRRRNLA